MIRVCVGGHATTLLELGPWNSTRHCGPLLFKSHNERLISVTFIQGFARPLSSGVCVFNGFVRVCGHCAYPTMTPVTLHPFIPNLSLSTIHPAYFVVQTTECPQASHVTAILSQDLPKL